MSATDATLLEQWVERGDAEAFREIVSRHSPMVYSTCRRILGSAAEAEDVAQECFETLAQAGRKPGTHLGAWLHRVATNLSLNRIRSEKRRKDREQRFIENHETSEEPRWDDIYGYLDEAVAELPEPFRVPVVAHFLENKSHVEIALALGVSRQTVTYRIGKGVELIRKSLRRRGIPVATSALAALMSANLADAGTIPASLAASLGKLALIGPATSVAAGSVTAGTAIGSKLAVLGGATIMWKNISVACGVVVLVLGLSYAMHTIKERQVSLRQTSTETSAVRTAKARPELKEPTAGSTKGAAGASKSAAQGDRLAGTGDDKELDAFLAREELLKSGGRKSDGSEGQSEQDALKPLTSQDIPPENGAHYFLLAAELFPKVDRDWLFARWDEVRTKGWSDDPQLLAFFDACKGSIDAIRQGLAVGNARMPDPRSINEPIPYLSTFRNLARVMALEAMKQAAEGNVAAALDTFITTHNFARESSRAAFLINGLVGVAMEVIALDSLREAMDTALVSPSDYRFLIEQMQTLDAEAHPLPENVVREAQFMRSLLDAEPSAMEEFRTMLLQDGGSSTDLRTAISNMSDEELRSLVRNALTDNEKAAQYLAMPYWEVASIDLEAVFRGNPLNQVFLPPTARLHAQLTKDRAGLRGTTIIAGIELYRTERGSYPASLDSLAPNYLATLPEDPFTGKPFLYRPTETGYLLYSAGADMEDNGGTALERWDADGADMVLHADEPTTGAR